MAEMKKTDIRDKKENKISAKTQAAKAGKATDMGESSVKAGENFREGEDSAKAGESFHEGEDSAKAGESFHEGEDSAKAGEAAETGEVLEDGEILRDEKVSDAGEASTKGKAATKTKAATKQKASTKGRNVAKRKSSKKEQEDLNQADLLKKRLKAAIKNILKGEIPESMAVLKENLEKSGIEPTNENGIAFAMVLKALSGDKSAADWVRDTSGEKPKDEDPFAIGAVVIIGGEDALAE